MAKKKSPYKDFNVLLLIRIFRARIAWKNAVLNGGAAFPPRTVNELADFLHVTPGTVKTLLEGLYADAKGARLPKILDAPDQAAIVYMHWKLFTGELGVPDVEWCSEEGLKQVCSAG